VLWLGASRLGEALSNGFVVLAIPTTVAVVPHDWVPFEEATRVGLIISLFGFVLAIAQPIVGRHAQSTRSQRHFMLTGIAGFALSTAAMGAVTSYEQLLALRVLQGLFMALVVPSTLALISYHAPVLKRGAAMGFYGMCRMLGFGLGPIVGGAALLLVSGRAAYLLASIPSLIAVLLIIFLVPRGNSQSHRQTRPGVEVDLREDPGLAPFLPLSAGMFACACALSIMAVLENEFMFRLSQSPLEFGLAFSAAVMVRVFADWPLGRLSDRIGRKTLIVPGLAALGPLTVISAYVPSTFWLVVVRIGVGVAMACVSPTTFALASDHAPPRFTARRVSWVTAGFAMGLAVGPLITGFVADGIGFTAPFWMFGGLCLVGAAYVHVAAPESARAPGQR